MTTPPIAGLQSGIRLFDYEPATDRIREDVIQGLSVTPRILPPKYFYDETGARLFEEICGLDEYYLTRTESAIHSRFMREIAARFGCNARIVEFGSGAGSKTRTLLSALMQPAAYIPVDIARAQLIELAISVSADFPGIEVLPVCADFSADFELPVPSRMGARTIALYHGSTIGNFLPDAAIGFLTRIGELCGEGSGLLIGADLIKDRSILESAYNDARGVTARFNLNLLERINRECGADFDVSGFRHHALYNEDQRRIEMRLECTRDQTVSIPLAPASVESARFVFRRGEQVITEYSYKYDERSFGNMVMEAGWTTERFWTDPNRRFGVWLLRRD